MAFSFNDVKYFTFSYQGVSTIKLISEFLSYCFLQLK